MKIKFNKNTSSLSIDRLLVVADLHIGIEKELSLRGITVPSQTHKMLKNLLKLAKRTKSQSLMILGDFKHNIPLISWQEQNEIPIVIEELKKVFKSITVIKGNHDTGLEGLARDKKSEIKIEKELLYGDIGFIHGHAFPSRELMEKSKVIIAGHVHPEYKLKTRVESVHSKKAWFMGECEFHGIKRKLIIVPAFNEFVGGAESEGEKFLKHGEIKEVLLLDLTRIK